MSASVLGLFAAVAASVALNVSYLIQRAGSAGAPAISPLQPVATARALLGSPVWLGGFALGSAGTAMQVLALVLAPISLVQGFVAGGLALAVPVGRRVLGEMLRPAELAAVGIMVVGLACISLAGTGGHEATSTATAATYTLLSAAAAIALVLLPGGRRTGERLGLAGGLFYGAAMVAVKALAHAGHGDALAVVASPWLEAALVLGAAGFFAFQRGLQVGPAIPVAALMMAGTNVVAVLAGFVVFGDPLGATPLLEAVRVAGFAAVGAATWLLAPAQVQVARPAAVATADGSDT
ncbi:MAG: hypothetical protein ACJ76V_08390 [Thermoleophilaceae bacterium]